MKKTILALLFLVTILSFTFIVANQEKALESTVSLKETSPFIYCCIPHKGPFTEIEQVIGRLMQAIQTQNIFPMGPLMGVYHSDPSKVKPEELEWEVGFPVTSQVLVQLPLIKKQWNFPTVAACLHLGPYEKTAETYAKIFEWMQANKYVQVGPVLERYLDMDPSKVKPENLRTEIWVPCEKSED